MLGSGLKGSLGSVGWPRGQRLVGCPCSFGSLELVFIIFLGVGCLWGALSLCLQLGIVFGVCFTGLGRGQCREMLSRSILMWLSFQLSRSVGAETTPGKSVAAAAAELPFEGVPTVGMPQPASLSLSPLSPQRRLNLHSKVQTYLKRFCCGGLGQQAPVFL